MPLSRSPQRRLLASRSDDSMGKPVGALASTLAGMHAPVTWIVGWALCLAVGCGGASAAQQRQPTEPAAATQALIDQAEIAERQRRYDQADALYEQARREAPDERSRAAAALAHGRALVFWGELDRAAAALDEAVRLWPDNAGAWHDLGLVRHHRGDLSGAEAALRQSIAVQPRDGRSRIALAALLWKQHRWREALHEYEALRELDLPQHVRDKVLWAIATLRQRVNDAP